MMLARTDSACSVKLAAQASSESTGARSACTASDQVPLRCTQRSSSGGHTCNRGRGVVRPNGAATGGARPSRCVQIKTSTRASPIISRLNDRREEVLTLKSPQSRLRISIRARAALTRPVVDVRSVSSLRASPVSQYASRSSIRAPCAHKPARRSCRLGCAGTAY